jgi:hypothetical protein
MADKTVRSTEPEVEPLTVPQEPEENLGTELLLAGQEGNSPPPPERVPVEDLGLDKLLGVDGQAAEPEPEPRRRTSG